MSNNYRKILFFPLLLIHSLIAVAQDDPYRAEIGLQVGAGNYAGDVNSIANMDLLLKNLKNIQPQVGVLLRYRINTRVAIRLGYSNTSVKGTYEYYNGNKKATTTLDNPIHFIDLWGEYNFFELNDNPHKRFSKKLSPYILLGIAGAVLPDYTHPPTLYPSIPMGIGIKLKLKNRWNLNMKLINHLMLSDNLEGNKKWDNPIPHTKNNILNNDLHTNISISLSYDIWERGCNCDANGYKQTKRKKR